MSKRFVGALVVAAIVGASLAAHSSAPAPEAVAAAKTEYHSAECSRDLEDASLSVIRDVYGRPCDHLESCFPHLLDHGSRVTCDNNMNRYELTYKGGIVELVAV